jgi:DNA polymerase-3 subunit alpha
VGQIDLGDAARFYPSEAALARWRAGIHPGRAVVVYDPGP